MTVMPRISSRLFFNSVASCLAAIGVTGGQQVCAGEPIAAPQAPTVTFELPVRPLTLSECLSLASEYHPRIAAQKQSLAASAESSEALDSMHTPGLLNHQLAVRRQQASLGVTAALAAVDVATQDTLYDVTRSYFTVLYAREQERVAQGVVDRLTGTYETAKKQLDEGAKDVTSTDVDRTLVYLRLAETRKVEASQGAKRALIALREAVGQRTDCNIEVVSGKLPESKAQPDRCKVVAAALASRGDLVQARVFADVASLEVQAQGTSRTHRVQTFASGSDIHVNPVPQAVRGNDYRPGAIGPEMPVQMAGSRSYRMQRASSLQGRADNVVEQTQNLIILEADDAFLRWEEATQQLIPARSAAETAEKLANDVTKDFTLRLKVRVEDVVNIRVLASQARSQYNEALYHQLLALADLERVTGGAFCAKLSELVLPKP
jgi:outer membrane protein TolC